MNTSRYLAVLSVVLAVAAVFAVGGIVPAQAQTAGQYVITGRFMDASTNQPVAGGVMAYKKNGYAVTSTANGTFTINLPTTQGHSSLFGLTGYMQGAFVINSAGVTVSEIIAGGVQRDRNVQFVTSGQGKVANVGDVSMWPSVLFRLLSDTPVTFAFVNGPGNGLFKTDHSLSAAFPLNTPMVIVATTQNGTSYRSQSLTAPLSAKGATFVARLANGLYTSELVYKPSITVLSIVSTSTGRAVSWASRNAISCEGFSNSTALKLPTGESWQGKVLDPNGQTVITSTAFGGFMVGLRCKNSLNESVNSQIQVNFPKGTLTFAKNSVFVTSTVVAGAPDVKIGSYTLTASQAENIRASGFTVRMGANGAEFRNLKLKFGASQFGATRDALAANGQYSFTSGSAIEIAKNSSVTLDVYADVLSSSAAGVKSTVTTLAGCTAAGAASNSAITCTAVSGQNVVVVPPASVSFINTNLLGTTYSVGKGERSAFLAEFDMRADGSPVTIENLKIRIVASNGGNPILLKNVTLSSPNPAINVDMLGAAPQDILIPAGVSTSTTFAFSRTFTLEVGSARLLRVTADIVDGDGTDNLQDNDTLLVEILSGSANGVSGGPRINVPAATVSGRTVPVKDHSYAVTAPAANAQLLIGSTSTITWNAHPLVPGVAHVSLLATSTENKIAFLAQNLSNTGQNAGSFVWTVGRDKNGSNIPAGQYRIGVQQDHALGWVWATSPVFTVLALNQLPTANAGPDQAVTDADGNGTELVTLSAAGSSDPDGTIVQYAWSANGSVFATSSVATSSLAVGTHAITLTVTDNSNGTSTDAVSVTVNPQPAEDELVTFVQKITASDGTTSDHFGEAIAVSGDYAIVGAPWDNGLRGSVYILKKIGSNWAEQAKLTAPSGVTGDKFGTSVSISGEYAIVGAYGVDSGRGSAHIFKRTGESWAWKAELTASDRTIGDYFGTSVSISGEYAVVGALLDNEKGPYSGSAYVFKRTGETWNQQAKLSASDGHLGYSFGAAVYLEGEYAVIGSTQGFGSVHVSGSAYVFKRTGDAWSQQAKLFANDGVEDDYFGAAVHFSGEYAVIGAPGDDDDRGSAYVFKRVGETWSQQAKLTAGDRMAEDNLGTSVSISGNYVVAGSCFDDDKGIDSGSAYVFKRTGDAWSQQAKIVASDGSAEDNFGRVVSLSGENLLIGANLDGDKGTFSGSVYAYRFNEPILADLTVTVTAPAAGQSFVEGTPITVTWNASTEVNWTQINVADSANPFAGGVVWNDPDTVYTGTRSQTLIIGEDIIAGYWPNGNAQIEVMVSDQYERGASAVSAPFTITVPPTPTGTIALSQNNLPVTALAFSATTTGPTGPNRLMFQALNVSNTSMVPVTVTASAPNYPGWLTLMTQPGGWTLQPGQGTQIDVIANAVSLVPNTYHASIVLTGNFTGSPLTVPVTLTVTGIGTVPGGSLTVTATGTVPVMRGAANQQVIASFLLGASPVENVSLSRLTLTLGADAAQFQNLAVKVNGSQFGWAQASLQPGAQYIFNGSSGPTPQSVVIQKGTHLMLEVYAEVLSSAATGTKTGLVTLASCEAVGTASANAVSCPPAASQNLQVIQLSAGAAVTSSSVSVTGTPDISGILVSAAASDVPLSSIVVRVSDPAPASGGAVLVNVSAPASSTINTILSADPTVTTSSTTTTVVSTGSMPVAP